MQNNIKVVIWGTGNSWITLSQVMKSNIQVVAYVTSDAQKSDEYNGKPLIIPQNIEQFEYDYLVICSIYVEEIIDVIRNIKIPIDKIILGALSKVEQANFFEQDFLGKRLEAFESSKMKPELIITGISYHNDGVDAQAFKVPAFNFALRGQDLFYDLQIVKYLYKIYDMSNLKYAIIGLSYYSFEYDMSKSSIAWEAIRYYPVLNNLHNLIDLKYCESYYKDKEAEINFLKIISQNVEQIFDINNVELLNESQAEALAKVDYNKKYPNTVWENKQILSEYIDFLEERKVKPIFLIMPAMECYAIHVKEHAKENFYKNLYAVLAGRQYQILDCFTDFYPREYYYHVNHFNKKGANVFTKKLNEDILW